MSRVRNSYWFIAGMQSARAADAALASDIVGVVVALSIWVLLSAGVYLLDHLGWTA